MKVGFGLVSIPGVIPGVSHVLDMMATEEEPLLRSFTLCTLDPGFSLSMWMCRTWAGHEIPEWQTGLGWKGP